MKTNITTISKRSVTTLLVALFASITSWAQFAAIYSDPYSGGYVQIGTEEDLGNYDEGASFTMAEPGQTVYFGFRPGEGYEFVNITYDNLSEDDVTALPSGIYSFTMPEVDANTFVNVKVHLKKKPVVVTGVNINEDNFPDENFRKWLLAQSYGKDAVITDAEMANINKILARACGIKDLTGIEYFTELTELYVDNYEGAPVENWNQITSVDLSHNTKLKKFYIDYNQLQSLDLSQNLALWVLSVSNNALAQLNVSSNEILQNLSCNDNQLTSLDVTNNPNLGILSCSGNKLTTLDLTYNPQLDQLYCDNNLLKTIDLSHQTVLQILNCYNNQLTSLEVNSNKLYQLYCYNNQIKDQYMDALVNSLPNFLYAYMVVLDLESEIEQNAITDEQIKVAKDKGWSVEGISGEEFVSLVVDDTHEYVDLGLTSGTLWATCNVGAINSLDAGLFFAWGDTVGHDNDTYDGYWYNWENYKWGEVVGEETFFTKYCSDSSRGKDGFTDGKYELDPEDDAASVNWGSEWRTPSKEQLEEFKKECTWTRTSFQVGNGYEIYGYEVTGTNGNSIFLPETGWRLDNMLLDGGAYWSRTGDPNDVGGAFYLGFDEWGWYSFGGRCDGQCVRPVYNKNTAIGDVNGDGMVTVTDVTMLVDYILGQTNDVFVIENADVNGDGGITVTDVAELVNVILGEK